MNDPVHNPSHYKSGGIEVIDVIEAFDLNFRLANVIKYVLRAGRKGDALEDLEKAAWYLDREIDKLYQQAEADEAADEPTRTKPVACAERPNVGDEVEEARRETLDVSITSVEQSRASTAEVDITNMDDVARRMVRVFLDTPIPVVATHIKPDACVEKQEYDG